MLPAKLLCAQMSSRLLERGLGSGDDVFDSLLRMSKCAVERATVVYNRVLFLETNTKLYSASLGVDIKVEVVDESVVEVAAEQGGHCTASRPTSLTKKKHRRDDCDVLVRPKFVARSTSMTAPRSLGVRRDNH